MRNAKTENQVKTICLNKHNAAVRSYSSMTLLQRKISNALLYNAYKNLHKQDFHEITISKMLNILNMETRNYQKLKHAIKQLLSIVIEWNVVQTKNNQVDEKKKTLFNSNEYWIACTLLSSVEICGTVIKYEYSQNLKNFFYKPEVYSKINLAIQNQFKSSYALVLYENCASYLYCGTTGWLSIDVFRKLMGVNKDEYKSFRDFKRRVLVSAVTEVNKVSNICVNYELEKIGRAVSKIKLTIKQSNNIEHIVCSDNKPNIQKVITKHEDSKDLSRLQKKLYNYGVSKKQADILIKKYEEEYVIEKLDLMESVSNEIKSPVAFLKTALKEDYKTKKILEKQNVKDIYDRQADVCSKIILSKKIKHDKQDCAIEIIKNHFNKIPETVRMLFEAHMKKTKEYVGCDWSNDIETVKKFLYFFEGEWRNILPNMLWNEIYANVLD